MRAAESINDCRNTARTATPAISNSISNYISNRRNVKTAHDHRPPESASTRRSARSSTFTFLFSPTTERTIEFALAIPEVMTLVDQNQAIMPKIWQFVVIARHREHVRTQPKTRRCFSHIRIRFLNRRSESPVRGHPRNASKCTRHQRLAKSDHIARYHTPALI